jgi:hypothetical protein
MKMKLTSKIPRERLFCIDKKLYQITVTMEKVVNQFGNGSGKGDDDDEDKKDEHEKEDFDYADDLDDLPDEHMNVDDRETSSKRKKRHNSRYKSHVGQVNGLGEVEMDHVAYQEGIEEQRERVSESDQVLKGVEMDGGTEVQYQIPNVEDLKGVQLSGREVSEGKGRQDDKCRVECDAELKDGVDVGLSHRWEGGHIPDSLLGEMEKECLNRE